MKASNKDTDFIAAVTTAKRGDEIVTDENTLVVEHVFSVPTHFPFQEKIFLPGKILKVKGDSNVRIHISAEKIGLQVVHKDKKRFVDKQKDAEGKIIAAEKGILRNPVKVKAIADAKIKAQEVK